MAKQSNVLGKHEMRSLWRYCEILKRHYQDLSYRVLFRAVLDEERRQRLTSEYLIRMGELHELQMALAAAIGARGEDDDD